MGSSSEIIQKCNSEFQKQQFRNLLPDGISLVPYDTLFERFRRNVTPLVIVESMPVGSVSTDDPREPKQFNLVLDDDGGYMDRYRTHLMTTNGWIPIYDGVYRQVFGVPRKIWPFEKRWVDNYFYEWKKQLDPENFEHLLRAARAKNFPIDAFDIQGYFDSNDATWLPGAKMTIYKAGHGIDSLFMQEWKFNFYEGDKLYFKGGQPVVLSAFS